MNDHNHHHHRLTCHSKSFTRLSLSGRTPIFGAKMVMRLSLSSLKRLLNHHHQQPGGCCQKWRAINFVVRTLTSSSSTTTTPPPPPRDHHHHHHHHRSFGNSIYPNTFKCSSSKSASEFPGIFSLAPAMLAGFLGVGMVSYADAKEADSDTPPLPESSPSLPESPPSLSGSPPSLAESPPTPAESPPLLLGSPPSLAESSPTLAESPPSLAESPPSLAESPPSLPEFPPSGYADVEKIVKEERKRLEGLLKSRGMTYSSYPKFTVAMKGQKVSIKFQIPPGCEIPLLIVDLASHLGLKAEQHGGGSDVRLRCWNSAVAWQLTLHHPEMNKADLGSRVLAENKDANEGNLCVLIFQSLISSDNAEIEFIKQGSFSPKELDALVSALKLAGGKMGLKRPLERRPREYLDRRENKPDTQKLLAALAAMGVRVFGLNETHEVSSAGEISWDNIAGYDLQKREIEDTILLALRSPKVYDDIARGTRRKFESNRPRAVLFEGPPGTGKTSCARVIANQAGVPLLYVPLEAVMSKYYGESERLFGTVFTLANGLPDGAIIFLDEIDSFAATRDDGMHEATRRILSVLLRQIDGFEQEKRVVVIAATNRKEDLDPALISRFDSMIRFGLPDQQTRQEISAQYAKHLSNTELVEFAAVTEEMSGRDIRDVCQQAERHWASKIIRGQASSEVEKGSLPPLQEYIDSALYRQKALLSLQEKKSQRPDPQRTKSPMDFL